MLKIAERVYFILSIVIAVILLLIKRMRGNYRLIAQIVVIFTNVYYFQVHQVVYIKYFTVCQSILKMV